MAKLKTMLGSLMFCMMVSHAYGAAVASLDGDLTEADELGAPEITAVPDGDGLYFIDHYSPYCSHCKALAPTFDRLAVQYASEGSVKFVKLDCIANGDLCSEHEIAAFPTLEMWEHGKKLGRMSGAKTEDVITEYVNTFLKSPGGSGTPDPEATKQEDSTAVAPSAPLQPSESATVNLLGSSISLSHESFQKLVTSTHDGWFVKFYAPWCGHCQAMAPAWAELSKELRGRMNVGQVNCDEEKRLCNEAKLRGYPTLLFFQGGERIEYDGLRGLGDLVAFANKAINAGVHDVDAAAFEQIEKKEQVIFLYFYDPATVSEDFEALERTALSLIGHAPLLKTSSEILVSRFRITTFPRLIAVRDGRPSYYTALSPRDMRDHKRLLAWMKSVWLPILPELSASNSHEIMQGRTVVLAVLDRSKDGFDRSKKEMKAAALEWMDVRAGDQKAEKQEQRDRKELKIEEAEDKGDMKALRAARNIHIRLKERKEVGFAWVDGVFWERWLKTTYGIDVRAMGERVIINEEDSKLYWDVTVDGTPIEPSRSIVLETLQAVRGPSSKIKPKSTQSRFENVLYAARGVGQGHPLASGGFLVAIVFALAMLIARRVKKSGFRARKLSYSNGTAPRTTIGKYD